MMKWNGNLYEGNHKPMISMSEFESVQDDLKSKRYGFNLDDENKPKFMYRGLFRCGACGAMITAENKTNRYGSKYTYYRCSHKNKKYHFCPEPYVQEQSITKTILEFLDSLYIPQSVENFALQIALKTEEERKSRQEQSLLKFKQEQVQLSNRLEKLRNLVVDEVITKEDYTKDRNKYIAELKQAEKKIEQMETGNLSLFEPLKETVLLLNRAKSIFEDGDFKTKRILLNLLCSNPTLKAKTPLISAKFPIQELSKKTSIPNLLTDWENFWNLYQEIRRFNSLIKKCT